MGRNHYHRISNLQKRLKNVFLNVLFGASLSLFFVTYGLAQEETQDVIDDFDPDFYQFPEVFKPSKKTKDSFSLERWNIIESDALPEPEVYRPLKEEIERQLVEEAVFKMQEHLSNYFIMGKPDTKIQFSFKFKFFRRTPVYLGYTQVMFWELGQAESNPFSELNYNPEIFYKIDNFSSLFQEINFGFAHLSNGKDEDESRAVDSLYLRLVTFAKYKFGIPAMQIDLRYLHNRDHTNKDIRDYYGPVVLKLYFNNLGRKLFYTEELFLEYYNGGDFADDFSKSSVRVSARFKIWKSTAAPKVFIQYFNGYGENLAKYNRREETYRMGISIGGF